MSVTILGSNEHELKTQNHITSAKVADCDVSYNSTVTPVLTLYKNFTPWLFDVKRDLIMS